METSTEFSPTLVQYWSKLDHQFNVIRKETIESIHKYVKSPQAPETDLQLILEQIPNLASEEKKELRQSCFLLGACFVDENEEFCNTMIEIGTNTLVDPESVVREAIADLFQAVAKIRGLDFFLEIKELLLDIMEKNFIEAEAPEDTTQVVEASIEREKKLLQQKLAGINTKAGGMDKWKFLFTAFKTMEKIIWGLETAFEPELDQALLDLIHRCTRHINRFIRESAYFTYGAVINSMTDESFTTYGEFIATELRNGLGDNWSQVRYASSESTRRFFERCSDPSPFYGILLPPMCLNRYYVAAGVRTYSQETWEQAFGNTGRTLVAEYARDVTTYYIAQSQADNHAVREASCRCIAELGNKIDKDALREFVPALLDTLIGCFKDESWPVRDCACLALGSFVSQFPDECTDDVEELYTLWFEHLSDNIPSVRQDTAVALGQVLQSYGDECLQKILPRVDAFVDMVFTQQEETTQFGQYENTTIFGVAAKKNRDNDIMLHMNQPRFSCGSLALKKSSRCGCMDHGFARDREPWEYTDGTVCLLTEVFKYDPSYGPTYLPKVAEIANVRNFAHYHKLQETIWTQVPKMAEAMGKNEFKRHLQPSGLLPPLLETLETGTMLSKATAGKCIMYFYKFLGEMIFESRLSEDQKDTINRSPHVVRVVEETVNKGGFTPGYISALQALLDGSK